MRQTAALLLAASLFAGCGNPMKRLSPVEHDHYMALRVYMNEDLRQAYLKYKTQDERDALLKSEGLWDRFYKYDAEMREAIIAGAVHEGWTEDRVFMSWGNPIDRKRLTGRPATRSEMLTYRFEVDDEGYVRVWEPGSKTAYKAASMYEIDVYLDDSRVSELVRRDK